jgi:hypothetical protein
MTTAHQTGVGQVPCKLDKSSDAYKRLTAAEKQMDAAVVAAKNSATNPRTNPAERERVTADLEIAAKNLAELLRGNEPPR